MTEAIDTTKLDPQAKKAFDYAVEFYEKDHDLTPKERSILEKTYSKISFTTLGVGWATFFAVTSVPFLRQRYLTGSTRGTNVGMSMIFGFAGMMVASPYGAQKSYRWQLEKLQQENRRCYDVAKLLKPGESTKWCMYYKLTKEHPEHIMKDPRSKEAAEQRQKTIYTGRDPMGLYSGPRAEMNRKRGGVQDAGEQQQQQQQQPKPIAQADDYNDDPFNDTAKQQEPQYTSAWDRVRYSNGQSTNTDDSWGKVRQQQQQQSSSSANPFTTNVYKIDKMENTDDVNPVEEQNEFDKLLEQERHIGEEEQVKESKW